jgi:hypothetical protein
MKRNHVKRMEPSSFSLPPKTGLISNHELWLEREGAGVTSDHYTR